VNAVLIEGLGCWMRLTWEGVGFYRGHEVLPLVLNEGDHHAVFTLGNQLAYRKAMSSDTCAPRNLI
jgi:hypothetical protein